MASRRIQIETMLTMQDRHNVEVHPVWREQGYAYYRAIWVECAELLDHHGWKWWKQQNLDREQVELEIVDIWHFGMSELIRASSSATDPVLVDSIERGFDALAPVDADFLEAVETLAAAAVDRRAFDLSAFVAAMNALPMSFDALYRIYISKNILNSFRQRHGYREGTYRKLWSGREDNVHLAELLEILDASRPSFPDDLDAALNERYASSI